MQLSFVSNDLYMRDQKACRSFGSELLATGELLGGTLLMKRRSEEYDMNDFYVDVRTLTMILDLLDRYPISTPKKLSQDNQLFFQICCR